jgi:hypothetical protein
MANRTARKPAKVAKKAAVKRGAAKAAAKPALLAGGNPRIAKADGDAPVQAYLAAMPGWKRDVGRRLDALIVATVPRVRKAVKWNSPFYGVEGQGWFLNRAPFDCALRIIPLLGAQPSGRRDELLPVRAEVQCVRHEEPRTSPARA